MNATVTEGQIEITRNGNRIVTVTIEHAIELANSLKAAATELATATVNAQQAKLKEAAALLEAAQAS